MKIDREEEASLYLRFICFYLPFSQQRKSFLQSCNVLILLKFLFVIEWMPDIDKH